MQPSRDGCRFYYGQPIPRGGLIATVLTFRLDRKLSTSMRDIWAERHSRNLWIDNVGHALIDECSFKSVSKQCRELAKLLETGETIDLYYRLRCYAVTIESQWRPEFIKLFSRNVVESDLPPLMPQIPTTSDDYFVCPSCGAQLLQETLPKQRT